MSRTIVPLCLLLLIHGFARADTPSTQPATVTGTLGKPENTDKIAAVLGRRGVLFIRSDARWDQLKKLVPDLTPDTPLPNVDFAKQNVVLVYDTACRLADTFSLTKHTVDEFNHDDPGPDQQLDFCHHWDDTLVKDLEAPSPKFILAVIPATPSVKVTLDFMPIVVKKPPIPITVFSATLGGKNGGDIVDGLQVTITPNAAIIKPGDDILIDFELHLASMPDAHPQQFGTDVIHVWDGSSPEGCRNHSFFVTTPDGKTTLLRPKEIVWERTPAPHPVEIAAKEPYHLPNGFKDGAFVSLQGIGLDTTTPGIYTITGIYEETADTNTTPDGKTISIWGGSITSDIVTVEVKAAK